MQVDMGHILTIVTILFTGGTSIAAVSIMLGKFSSTIASLISSVDKLTESVDRLEDKVGGHGERLARLEASSQ